MSLNVSQALKAVHLVESAYALPNVVVGNAQALVTYNESEQEIQIAIAGSNDWHDWWQNTKFVSKKITGVGKIHKGFYDHAMALSGALLKEIRKYPDGVRIFMSSHSLGSSTAVVLMSRYYALRSSKVTSYLFGCPRVGNGEFKEYFHNGFSGRLYNVQNAGDPVCTGIVDKGLALIGWRHVDDIHPIGTGWSKTPDHPIRFYRKELERVRDRT